MAKPIGNPRTIAGAQEQWETLRTEIEGGVIRYHRQRVVRDGQGAQVGASGPVETVTALAADLPNAEANALARILAYGDTL